MTEYKHTLNLPETDFPMKASLSQREPHMLAKWNEEQLYQKIRAFSASKKKFILHDGPPYANGHLHCGHALNKILKDMLVKSRTLSGYDAAFVPGWDCHGLPIELNVEKKFGKAGVKIDADTFRQKCRDYANSQIDIQREEFKRLGVIGDWENPYRTMSFGYEANIVRALGKMIENNHLSQGFKPVHWCIDCGSALAEAEVEYEDKVSPSIDVAFFAQDTEKVLSLFDSELAIKPVIVPIWTTTPWTLPANEAVCLHPEIKYALVDANHQYFVVAEELVESVMARYGVLQFSIKGIVAGKALELISLNHPFQGRLVPIILGEHVTIDAGTGCVHTAPAHGPDDYVVAKKYDIPFVNPVKTNGCYDEHVEELAGISVVKSNDTIIEMLKNHEALLSYEHLTHSYPHCWRHKSPMIFLATPQWFISMDKNGLRDKIMQAIDGVEWVPDWNKARIKGMIEGRPDWCISRQRAWGTPMPLFIHKSDRSLHPRTLELIEEVAKRIEQKGIDAWFSLDAKELLGDDARLYEKVTDTMDVWLDSGVSHFAVLNQRNELSFPADVYLEGSDQHRGWFNSSITTSVAINGVTPYKSVLTHGFTVDAEGKKLSKSKGNYVALDQLINQYGADVLRLWVASTDYRHEVSISDEIMKRTSDAYRRLRNTARFLLANIHDFNAQTDMVEPSNMPAIDQYILAHTYQLQKEIIDAYEDNLFHVVYQKVHHFCSITLGGFYLDIIKDRQYTTKKDSVARRSCQTAMYHIIQALTRWLAPMISFTAEEIWQHIDGARDKSSVFCQEWYQELPELKHVDLAQWAMLQDIRTVVNKALEQARQAGIIGSGLAANVEIYANETQKKLLESAKDELRFLLITSEASVHPLSDFDGEMDDEAKALGIGVKVVASDCPKCARCWHRRPDVGTHEEHPELCGRCIDNITSKGETREFA